MRMRWSRRQGSWLGRISNCEHEGEQMRAFLLEAEKAQLVNGSNEGMREKGK